MKVSGQSFTDFAASMTPAKAELNGFDGILGKVNTGFGDQVQRLAAGRNEFANYVETIKPVPTELQALTTANEKTNETINQQHEILTTQEGAWQLYTAGVNDTILKLQGMEMQTEKNKAAIESMNANLENGTAITDAYALGWTNAEMAFQQSQMDMANLQSEIDFMNTKLESGEALVMAYFQGWQTGEQMWQQQLTSIASVAAQLDFTETKLASGEEQVANYFEGWNAGRQIMQDLEADNNRAVGTFDALNASIGRFAMDNFVKGWNDYRQAMIDSIGKTNEMIGTWNSFVDSINTAEGALQTFTRNWNEGFTTGLNAGREFFEGTIQDIGEMHGEMTSLNGIIGRYFGQEIPQAFRQSTSEAEEWVGIIMRSPESLNQAIGEMNAKGHEFIDALESGIDEEKGGLAATFQQLEQDIGFMLPDSIKWNLELDIGKEHLADQIDTQIGALINLVDVPGDFNALRSLMVQNIDAMVPPISQSFQGVKNALMLDPASFGAGEQGLVAWLKNVKAQADAAGLSLPEVDIAINRLGGSSETAGGQMAGFGSSAKGGFETAEGAATHMQTVLVQELDKATEAARRIGL